MPASIWDGVSIGSLRLANRAVMPAMGTGYCSMEGEVTERLLAYHKRRAGGAGLIITEVCAVHPLGKCLALELGIYDDSFLPGLERLAETVKAGGSAVAAQIGHAGRETFESLIGAQPVAPSPIPSRTLGQVPRALSGEEIAELVGCHAAAARRAREAGFDAVEIHAAHGYLVNQFLSPYSNRREDGYGRDDAGRFRFAREIVREVRREVGKDFPILFRFSSSEMLAEGYDLDYILPLLVQLEGDGVDAFHVSCGIYDAPGNPTCPGMHHPAGINVERAARVKEAVGVPVIVVGKIHDPRMADEILAAGKADLVAFGRQHLADPLFLRKAAEGRYDDIRFCLSCNQGCLERLMLEFMPATCSINPECGEEWRTEKLKTKNRGPFLVVGAGPAGLQASLTMREAGAEVRVVEREAEPGGQLRACSRPDGKEPYADWVSWAVRRLSSLGTKVELGVEAGEETLLARSWQGVVDATGARPLIPDIPGARSAKCAEAREVLLGERDPGDHVLVVGAGLVGMETADYLIHRGCEVTVVEELEYTPVLPLTSHGHHLHGVLGEKGRLLLGTRVLEVTGRGALLSTAGEEREMEADTVVWAVGSRPEGALREAAERAGVGAKAVGDAVEPRRVLEAVHEAYWAAWELMGSEG
ncbi:MAG: FAD-dependent oxidoreductase [Actinobacteria bacterium]|nr:FAD-dependent oxidoreductase [Actinomycetota bacterium]